MGMKKEGVLNRTEVCFQVGEAIQAAQSLVERVRSGELDEACPMVLRIDFEHILGHLCAAWHRKYLSNQEIDEIDDSRFELMYRSVPNWSLNLQLVDMEEQL
jgi:hypothetical protein